MAAVPSPLSWKLTPAGSVPLSLMAAVVYAFVVMPMLNGVPSASVVFGIFVIFGALVIARLNGWVPVPALLLAVSVIGYTPMAPLVGVPEIVAVPLPLSAKVTPAGRAPLLVSFGAG